MPLWLAYDHWTALRTAENVVARQMAHTADPSLVEGTQAFLTKVGDVLSAQTPELIQRAHDLVGAPHLFGMEVGFNLPAFCIALVITAILVIGIQESARFNSAIVMIKVAVVLFVIALGMHYVHPGNWGNNWSTFAPMGFGGIGAGAAYIFFAYIGFDAVSTTAQEATKSAARSAHRNHCLAGGLHRPLHTSGRRADGHGALERNQHRSPASSCVHGPRTHQSLVSDHSGSAGGPDQRNAGNAARPDPRPLFHGQ